MMENIDVFVEVVDAQSFTGAAARLKMPTTTVSAKIAKLEERLGTTLIQRTTRRLFITPAGQRYYQHCTRALAEMNEGEKELIASNTEAQGLLRITAPADISQLLVAPLVERFLETYPKTEVELIVTNKTIELISEGIDLAIRAGPLPDSTLVVRKFVAARVGLWASKKYVTQYGQPNTEAELQSHQFVGFSRRPTTFQLKNMSNQKINVTTKGRVTTDDLENLMALVERGLGIGVLPDFIDSKLIAQKALMRILPDYSSDVGNINFAYPAQRFVPQTVRSFIAVALGKQVAF